MISTSTAVANAIRAGVDLREGQLGFVYSAAAALFFMTERPETDVGYMPKSKAVEHLKKELEAKLKLGATQLNIYLRSAEKLFTIITSSRSIFADTISKLNNLPEKDADKAGTIIREFYETKSKSRVDSIRALNIALGYAPNRNVSAGGGNKLKDEKQFAEAIGKSIETVEAELVEGGKVKPQQLAQAVMSHVSDPVPFIFESIKRITSPDVLLDLAKQMQAAIDIQLEVLEKAVKTEEKEEAPAIVPDPQPVQATRRTRQAARA